jgi:predicted NBD/HSP70 family sugar kinase
VAGVQTSLREANRALVVDAVRRFGGLTQIELAGTTGLSPSTVSAIVKELLAAEAVTTRTTVRNGRRAVMVTMHRRAGLAVGVRIGVRHLEVVLADAAYGVLARHVLPLAYEHRADRTLDRTALLVLELLERVGATLDEVVGVGIGVSAAVDRSAGTVIGPGLLHGWEEVSIVATLSARLGRPVFVDKDANLGALAEVTRGAGRPYRDILYVRASHRTSAGVVIDRAVHHGPSWTAGEIGHCRVVPGGDICVCGGRGCLDTVVGTRALVAPLAASHGSLTLADVVRGATEGDPGCSRVVADAGAVIGEVVANLMVGLGPQCIVVGGELAETGEVLLGPVRQAVGQRTPLAPGEPPPVVPAELGSDAEVVGALAMVMAQTDPSRSLVGGGAVAGSLG